MYIACTLRNHIAPPRNTFVPFSPFRNTNKKGLPEIGPCTQQQVQTLDEVIDTVLYGQVSFCEREATFPSTCHTVEELICSPAGGVNNDSFLKRGEKVGSIVYWKL